MSLLKVTKDLIVETSGILYIKREGTNVKIFQQSGDYWVEHTTAESNILQTARRILELD